MEEAGPLGTLCGQDHIIVSVLQRTHLVVDYSPLNYAKRQSRSSQRLMFWVHALNIVSQF